MLLNSKLWCIEGWFTIIFQKTELFLTCDLRIYSDLQRAKQTAEIIAKS